MTIDLPRFLKGKWWVSIPDPTAFSTRVKAAEARNEFKKEHGCLHAECNQLDTDDLGLGVGFRFCPLHARKARTILNKHIGA
ncbi:hypothetical protein HMPREF2978_00560 [Corynebacterium sp. HMSC074C01]|nr:hypothetical protein HMPREF2978_00560 [Corynebacterium sp. HMSC074C01]